MNIVITKFQNRRNPHGEEVRMTWDGFLEIMRRTNRTSETSYEYANMTNEERTECKDVGGYIAGQCEGARRSKSTVLNRCLLTIDADDAASVDFKKFDEEHDCVYFCHATHSSSPSSLRLRWIIPLARPVSGDEYRALISVVKHWVGAEGVDETTDQPERLMFWPSICSDATYEYWEGGWDLLDPDEILDEYEPLDVVEVVSSSGEDREEDFEVPEGQRNKTLFGFAASLRSNGMNRRDILSMLEVYNDNHCVPPMPSSELWTIANSVCSRYKPGDHVNNSLRDAWDDFNDLGEWKEEEQKPKVLSGESFADLCSRDVAAPKFVIDGLISTGITILASPPKFGKSWMCFDIGSSVAMGSDFLGMKTQQGCVLYFALEDGDFRLKDRGLKVNKGRELPRDLILYKDAPMLQDGLLTAIYQEMQTHHNVSLVIIDTLQKIRGTAGKTEGVYGYDYRELGELHNFAIRNNIAVVLVHHLNKGGDDNDFVSRLNGSTGISGAADTIITLTRSKRGDKETKMSIVGRDVNERTLILQMDWGTYRWLCLGDERDVEDNREETDFYSDPIVKTILYHLEEAEDLADDGQDCVTWTVSAQDLANEICRIAGEEQITCRSVGRAVSKLEQRLESKEGVSHDYEHKKNARFHVFKRNLL